MNIDQFFEVFTGGNSNVDTWTPKAIKEFAEDYHKEQLRIGGVSQQRELLIGYIMNEQKLYCGKPDRKLSEELADDYIANL